jgi:hypothetical protein
MILLLCAIVNYCVVVCSNCPLQEIVKCVSKQRIRNANEVLSCQTQNISLESVKGLCLHHQTLTGDK